MPTTAPPQLDSAEYHAFRGSPAEVARRLYALPRDVVRMPLTVLLIESDALAEGWTFERARPDDTEGPVAVWDGARLGDLPARLAGILVAPGDPVPAIRAALAGHGPFTAMGVVPCPPTARAAFGHPMRRHGGETVVRAVVVTAGPAR